jgi:hypothetical protein
MNEVKVYVVSEVSYDGEERFDEGCLDISSKVFTTVQDAKKYMDERFDAFIEKNESLLEDEHDFIDDYTYESDNGLEKSFEYYNEDTDQKLDIYLTITEQIITVEI